MSIKLLLLIFLTCARQIPEIVRILRHHAKVQDTKYIEDISGTFGLYMFYIALWLGALLATAIAPARELLYGTGTGFIIVGTALRWWALTDLGDNFTASIVIKDNGKLVTHGIYARIRHPLHLALLMECFGMFVVSGYVWLLPLWAGLLGVVGRRTVIEDRVLLQAYGNPAGEYQRKVPAMNLVAGLFGRTRVLSQCRTAEVPEERRS